MTSVATPSPFPNTFTIATFYRFAANKMGPTFLKKKERIMMKNVNVLMGWKMKECTSLHCPTGSRLVLWNRKQNGMAPFSADEGENWSNQTWKETFIFRSLAYVYLFLSFSFKCKLPRSSVYYFFLGGGIANYTNNWFVKLILLPIKAIFAPKLVDSGVLQKWELFIKMRTAYCTFLFPSK